MKDRILKELNEKVAEIIIRIEDLKDQYEQLGMLEEYNVRKEELIKGINAMFGVVAKRNAVVNGNLIVGISGPAYIEDQTGRRHEVTKKFVEVDIQGNGQYSKVHLLPTSDSSGFLRWNTLAYLNGKIARFKV
ncbi:hypothetical protein [Gottfriedia luciferensis]|uniref:hypothetical protein n=1 Tax=Gottfriedia luciferensis TaxID=178774 RepID=UPI000B44B767|nr:hypothetical protein [Gottfriedia luciferensis]